MSGRLEQIPLRKFRTWMLLLVSLLFFWGTHAQASFLGPDEAFRLKVERADGGKVWVSWMIAPGYYLFRDRLTVTSAGGGSIGEIKRPPGERKSDPNFGVVEVFHDAVTVEVDAGTATALQVSWQGCAEQGLCYPPQKRTVALGFAPGSAALADAAALAGSLDSAGSAWTEPAVSFPPLETSRSVSSPGALTESGITRIWSSRSLWWSLPLAFVLGVGLAFTPCVLPMLPILSGIVVRQQASTGRALLLSLAFVIAMSLVYAGMGMIAALAGAGLQAALQNPWVITGFAMLFLVLAFSMFGFYQLQLPAFLRDRLAALSPHGGSVAGASAMGALSALLVGPCMTAPLAGTLLYIAQSGNVVEGAMLLLALGLGMGAPLVLVSTVGARSMPRPGPWMNRVKGAFGFVMLGTAVWMLERVVPGSVELLLWGALLASAALTLWHSAAAWTDQSGAVLVFRSGATVAGIWGAAMLLGAAAGASDPLRPLADVRLSGNAPVTVESSRFEIVTEPAVLEARLEEARTRNQPALVEFSADWCTSCKTLEREVFADPRVNQALHGVMLLRADITASDAAQQAFMRAHEVVGPPTVMLFDARGVERRLDRLVGEFAPEELLERDPAGRGRS